MYNGYKIVSCRNELFSILQKLNALGYKWGGGSSLRLGHEVDSMERLYDYPVGLVFSDTKRVYYCDADSAPGFVDGKR